MRLHRLQQNLYHNLHSTLAGLQLVWYIPSAVERQTKVLLPFAQLLHAVQAVLLCALPCTCHSLRTVDWRAPLLQQLSELLIDSWCGVVLPLRVRASWHLERCLPTCSLLFEQHE